MVNNYYTLLKLLPELKILEGCVLEEVFTQDLFNTVLHFSDGEESHFLNLFERNRIATLFLHDRFAKARSNTNNIFQQAEGDILQNITLIEFDRIFKLEFIRYNLYIEPFGLNKTNIILTDKSGLILDSQKSKYTLLDKYIDEFIFYPEKQFNNDTEILKQKYKIPALYLQYFINKYKSTDNIPLFINEISENNVFIYRKNLKELILSVIPLDNIEIEYSSQSASQAIAKYVALFSKYLDLDDLKLEMSGIAEKNKKKLENSLNKSLAVLMDTSRIENYRLWGNLLLSGTNLKEKGRTEITVKNWDESEIKIQLDPKINFRENADKYFQKAKNAEKENKIIENRIPNLESELNYINTIISEITAANDKKQLKELQEKYPKLFRQLKKEYQNEGIDKFRVFEIGSGFKLYVGKNAANNEELTLKFASPHDIWLHARGVGGSHCIIKRNRNQHIPKEIIERAAEIAAYYSQARNGKYVPVVYTEKKYVRKPKGYNIGAVSLQKEEVIMVDPKL